MVYLQHVQLEELDSEMMKNATNSAKLSELTAKQEEVQKALDEKMERWMYLEELAAKTSLIALLVFKEVVSYGGGLEGKQDEFYE